MKIQYLEIVTTDVETQCALYAKLHGAKFTGPIAQMGNAMVAALNDGSRVGIRAPMHEKEEPGCGPIF